MRRMALLLTVTLAACSAPGGPYPSLQPRAGETIDPRLPVVRPVNDRPATASLVEQLSVLVAEARSGNATFDSAAAQAERLAATAGPPQSEGWIAAQEALTAAIAARKPTATALGDIDALAADALQVQRGLAPNDLAAIKNAQAEVGELDARQAARIDEVKKRLGG